MQKLKKSYPRAIAILLSLMMMVVFVPTFAFAADAGSITVFLTVSYQGELAKAKDGTAMGWKEVKVTDVDGDGQFTVDETLIAAHDMFLEGGAAENYINSSGFATKVWGKETGTALFFVNDDYFSDDLKTKVVAEGDYLTAALLKDESLYSDYYSTFDKKTGVNATVGSNLKMTLLGHPGMAWTPDTNALRAIPNAKVKDSDGNVLGTTNENGEVSIKFSKPGTYIVTAEGAMKNEATDWSMMTQETFGMDIGIPDDVYFKMIDDDDDFPSGFALGYTDENMGVGPYPMDKVHWIDCTDWYSDDEFAGYLLTSNNFIVDGPLMAPACIVTVKPAEAVQPAAPAQPSEVKDLPAVKITKAKKAKKAFTVKWKKVSKKNKKKIAGIEVQYSLTKSFSNPITKTAKKTKTSLKVKKLSAKTNYYVRVRAYKNENGVKHISAWSKVKKVKTK